ncbi:HlyD family efflux transporter periplasmic adaptor subunit [Microbulbifer sp.]|uniref:efflux RND transporter periplasmic adaptor subunit n=1 Tax=Microbulbifer sp. TaxID=1908541 RepID=UPI002590923D|nr:HlyD family efflux transporter periplasmic adaptor subunit [Microbulbifer sp.]
MDIAKTRKPVLWKRPLLVTAVAIPLLTLVSGFLFQPDHFPLETARKIHRSELLFGSVQRGDLELVIDGYGVLRSNRQTLITALSAATVEEVVLRPGARVRENSIILRLSNPELLQRVDAAAMAISQAKASLRRLKLNNRRELLAEQASLATLNADLEVIKLQREAERQLVADGVVPRIAYQTTVLQQEQMQQRLALQQQRIQQLEKVATESQTIQQNQIDQARAHHRSLQQRAERLTVRAGLEGILQRLPVELGQSVAVGQELALVSSEQDLVALIQVSQSRAEELQIGQTAKINTRRELASGAVTRIAPEVREGTVEVEVAFSDRVPDSARPEQNVDARIFTATIKNALYIERPLNARSHSAGTLFRLQEGENLAQRQPVQFGVASGRLIQLESGASEKDRFILSDTDRFSDAERIRILH